MTTDNVTSIDAAETPHADSLTNAELEAIARSGYDSKRKGIKQIDRALIAVRTDLFQVMGIVRLASHALREPVDGEATTAAWTALNGAHALLDRIVDRLQDGETLLGSEVQS